MGPLLYPSLSSARVRCGALYRVVLDARIVPVKSLGMDQTRTTADSPKYCRRFGHLWLSQSHRLRRHQHCCILTLLSIHTMVRMQRCCAVQRYACSTLLYGTPRSTMPAYSDLSSCGCGSWVVAVGTVSRCIAIAVVEGSSVCFPLTPNLQCAVPFIPAAFRGRKRGASLTPLDWLVLFLVFVTFSAKISALYTTPRHTMLRDTLL